MSVDTQRAFLTTAFSDSDGGVRIAQYDSESPTIHVIGEGDDSSCLRSDVESWVDLRTTSGDVVGCCILLDTPEEADEFLDSHDDPSTAVKGDDGTIALVYLFDRPVKNDDLTTNCPLPSLGYALAFEEDAPVDGVMPITRYVPEDVLAWYFPASEVAPESVDTTDKFNDATIYGELDDALLGREIVVSKGTGRKCVKWVSSAMTIADFITGLSINKVGQKDGPAFTQGEIEGSERRGNLVTRQHIFGLDVDCGYDIDTVHRMVADLGLLTVIYTTHSHLTTHTDIAETTLNKWLDRLGLEPNAETCKRFLVEEKGYIPAIVNTLTFNGRKMVPGTGTCYSCDHGPMPKFRVVFFLDHPFDVMKEAPTSDGARKKWVRKIYGMAKLLGNLPIDQSCIDLSRLFYLPRRKAADSVFETRIIAGSLLNLDEIEEIDPKKSDPFESVASKLGGNDIKTSRNLSNGMSLMRWARDRGDGFQIAELFRDYAPERIRQDQSEDKLTIECPFDDIHSNAGDSSDLGCWVQNGASATSDSGFAFACSHNGCKKQDRLDMICEAIDKEWFPEEALLDPKYQALEIEEYAPESDEDEEVESSDGDDEEPTDADKASIYAALIPRSKALTEGASIRDVRNILRQAVDSELSAYEIDQISQAIMKATKVRPKAIDAELKQVVEARDKKKRRKEAKNNQVDSLEASEEESLATGEMEPYPGCTAFFTNAYESDEYAYFRRIAKIFTAQNQKNPRVFEYSGAKIVAVLTAENKFQINDVSKEILVEEANKVITKFALEDDKMRRVRLTIDDVAPLLADVDVKFPPVERFEEMPFFNSNGKIIRDNGYDPTTRTLLTRAEDIVVPEFAFDPNPSADLVDEAVNELFQNLFFDFPFDDQLDDEEGNGNGSRSHLLAMMLQPLVRLMIDGPTPFYLVNKPSPATGGSLLVDTALRVSSGANDIATQSEKGAGSSSDDEWRKAITSVFHAGKKDIWFDNVNFKLDSPALANLATAKVWEDRFLGKNTLLSYRNLSRVCISGNNVRTSDEILRRCAMIRIDYKKGDPKTRTEFRISDLESHVALHRGRYYGYLMVLVNRWLAVGKPAWSGKNPLASFESWSRVMGGILEAADISGFLSNTHLTSGAAARQETTMSVIGTSFFQKFGFDTAPLHDIALWAEGFDDMPTVEGVNMRNLDTVPGVVKLIERIQNSRFVVYRPGHEDGDFFAKYVYSQDPKNPTKMIMCIRYADDVKNKTLPPL